MFIKRTNTEDIRGYSIIVIAYSTRDMISSIN